MGQTKADLQYEIRCLRNKIRALEHAANYRQGTGAEFLRLTEQLPVVLWTTDSDLRVTTFDGASAEFGKFRSKSVVGLTLQEFFGTQKDSFLPISAAQRALQGETLQYSHDWHEKYMLVHVSPMRDTAGRIVGVAGVALDLSDQRESESWLRDIENRYRALLDSIDELVFWYEFDGTVVFANAAAERLLGYPAAGLRGKSICDVLSEESAVVMRNAVHMLLGGGAPGTIEVACIADSGRQVSLQLHTQLVLSHGQPFCIQATGRDMTERKALQQQMRMSQKTQALGLLGAAVAHDMANTLTCLLGNAEMLQRRLPEQATEVQPIIADATRAAKLAKSLANYSRMSASATAAVDLHEVIREALVILQKTRDKRYHILASLRASQSVVTGDAQQLQQAVLTLCTNACDAMPHGGDLRVYTRNSGSSIVLSVQDNGRGVRELKRSRSGDPLLAADLSGGGTHALATALVEGVVRNHSGAIHAVSRVDRGTVWHVTLPVVRQSEGKARRNQVVGGRGRILVADDDSGACQLLGKALRSLGYDVELATRSDAAKHYGQAHPHIDVVFFDAGSTAGAAAQMLKRLRELNPQVRVVILSGAPLKPSITGEKVEVLSKPYRYQDLASALQRLFERGAAHNA